MQREYHIKGGAPATCLHGAALDSNTPFAAQFCMFGDRLNMGTVQVFHTALEIVCDGLHVIIQA